MSRFCSFNLYQNFEINHVDAKILVIDDNKKSVLSCTGNIIAVRVRQYHNNFQSKSNIIPFLTWLKFDVAFLLIWNFSAGVNFRKRGLVLAKGNSKKNTLLLLLL